MNIIHGVIRFLVVVAVGTLGGVLTAGNLLGNPWAAGMAVLGERGAPGLWLGCALLFLTALFLVTGLRRRTRTRYLSFDNEGGAVSISTDAIAGYIGKLDKEFPSIIELKPRVVPLRSSIDVAIDLRIKAGPQIHEICQVLQQRVRESLSSGLGITQVERVEVTVREINTEHKPE